MEELKWRLKVNTVKVEDEKNFIKNFMFSIKISSGVRTIELLVQNVVNYDHGSNLK